MFLVPFSAASIFGWMLRSQIPVRFDGASTNAPGSGGRLDEVDVDVLAGGPVEDATGVGAVGHRRRL